MHYRERMSLAYLSWCLSRRAYKPLTPTDVRSRTRRARSRAPRLPTSLPTALRAPRGAAGQVLRPARASTRKELRRTSFRGCAYGRCRFRCRCGAVLPALARKATLPNASISIRVTGRVPLRIATAAPLQAPTWPLRRSAAPEPRAAACRHGVAVRVCSCHWSQPPQRIAALPWGVARRQRKVLFCFRERVLHGPAASSTGRTRRHARAAR